MAKETFVCLANSRKLGGRCLAGILLVRNEDRWEVKRDRPDNPLWIRPVARESNGELSYSLVSSYKLLDILEVENLEACPSPPQTENIYFDHTSLRKIDSFPISRIDDLLDVNNRFIFSNDKLFVPSNTPLTFSLMFVKTERSNAYLKLREGKPPQPRLTFEWKSKAYNLPITDEQFCTLFDANPEQFNGKTFYITISLGEEYGDKRFKLIAGIIYV